MKKLKIKLQSKFLFKILAIIALVYGLVIVNFYPFKSAYDISDSEFIGTVTKINIDGNKYTLEIKAKERLIVNYYFKTEKEKNYFAENIKYGDVLDIKGVLELPSSSDTLNLFDYKNYLYNNKIYYLLNATSITKIQNNNKIYYLVKQKITDRINSVTNTSSYLKTFILADKSDLDKEVLNSYQTNGISHLFCVSGMHISLFAAIIFFFLKKISYNNYYNYGVVISFLVCYGFLIGFSASVLRSIVMFILFTINKLFGLKIKSLDIILFTLVVVIIIDPFMLYNVGFQFSYLTVFFLILFSEKTKYFKTSFSKSIYTTFLCFLVSMPLCLYYFYQVNVISIILNVFMIPFVSVIIFPLTLLTFIFPFLDTILLFFVTILEKISLIFNNFTFFQINLRKPSFIMVILYYLLIIIGLYRSRYLFLLIIFLIFHKSIGYLDNGYKVVTIDVGQGDSLLLSYPYQKTNILIDTGGIVSYNQEKWKERKETYSIVKSKTITYLKSLGISKLDYLILTHGDFDHMGEAINLVNNFKVEKVIFNCGEFNNLEKELTKVLDKKKIKYYSCIKELNIDDNKLYFLQTKEYDNENDNSSVIYTELNGYKFMFMGDASSTTEKEIMDKYNLPDIDVLKVGHHGSKTSSSKEFINAITPKYSIISVGKNNRYGHPNKEVLNNLENSKIYRTDIDGSIMFKIKNNKLKIETCSP